MQGESILPPDSHAAAGKRLRSVKENRDTALWGTLCREDMNQGLRRVYQGSREERNMCGAVRMESSPLVQKARTEGVIDGIPWGVGDESDVSG